jgi:hypothetical protein
MSLKIPINSESGQFQIPEKKMVGITISSYNFSVHFIEQKAAERLYTSKKGVGRVRETFLLSGLSTRSHFLVPGRQVFYRTESCQ